MCVELVAPNIVVLEDDHHVMKLMAVKIFIELCDWSWMHNDAQLLVILKLYLLWRTDYVLLHLILNCSFEFWNNIDLVG